MKRTPVPIALSILLQVHPEVVRHHKYFPASPSRGWLLSTLHQRGRPSQAPAPTHFDPSRFAIGIPRSSYSFCYVLVCDPRMALPARSAPPWGPHTSEVGTIYSTRALVSSLAPKATDYNIDEVCLRRHSTFANGRHSPGTQPLNLLCG